jgi:hypothetical protein
MNKYIYIIRNNKNFHIYGYNLELYNSNPSVADCIFYNKLPKNIKEIKNKNQFTRELKKLLTKRCYYSTDDYLKDDFSDIGY